MKTTSMDLTAAQALYVLDRMLKEKVVSVRDVRGHLEGLNAEIKTLESRLAELRDASSSSSAPAAASAAAPAAKRRRGRPSRKAAAPAVAATTDTAAEKPKRVRARKGKKSKADVAASMKLQGVYLSLINRLDSSKREQFKTIAREQGREAAIARMRQEVSK